LIQHIFHMPKKITRDVPDTPLFLQPGFSVQ
jgi:hypothetical protein